MLKPKLTPEERRALKKQKKIEKKLQKEERKRQVKRDELEREIKYGQLTHKNHEKEWRAMLVKAAAPRMREELEFAWHNFERVIDAKDFQISLLKDELRESEEQYMLNFTDHLENIEKLLKMFDDRLDEFKEDYDSEVTKMQNQCELETDDTKDTANESLNYIKTMLYQLSVAKRVHERIKKAEYYSRLDEVEVKNQLAIQKLRAHLESKYQNMFNTMKQFIRDYERQLKDRKKEHKILKDADDGIQELITQQFHQIKKLYDTLRDLRQKFGDMKQSEGTKCSELQTERRFFADCFRRLKTRLAFDQKNDFNKLARLSSGAADAFDYMEGVIKKGETILKLAAVCRKLETQKEKILPFPVKEFEKSRGDDEELSCVREEMTLFWQRVGLAYSVHFTLLKEQEFLKDENHLIANLQNEDYFVQAPRKPTKNKVINKIDAQLEVLKYQMSGASLLRVGTQESIKGIVQPDDPFFSNTYTK